MVITMLAYILRANHFEVCPGNQVTLQTFGTLDGSHFFEFFRLVDMGTCEVMDQVLEVKLEIATLAATSSHTTHRFAFRANARAPHKMFL